MSRLAVISGWLRRLLRWVAGGTLAVLSLWLAFVAGRGLGWAARGAVARNVGTNSPALADATPHLEVQTVGDARSTAPIRRRLARLLVALESSADRAVDEARLRVAIADMSAEEIMATLEVAETWPPSVRRTLFEHLIERWVELDAPAAFEWALDSLQARRDHTAWWRLFRRWGLRDVAAALSAAERVTQPDVRHNAMFTLHTLWAARDPKGAFEAALRRRGADREAAIDAVSEFAARSDAREKLLPQLVAGAAASADGHDTLCRFFGKWASHDSGAAFDWLDSAPLAADAKESLEGTWFAGEVQRDARAAADHWLARTTPDRQARQLESIVKTWLVNSGNDFNACGDWLAAHIDNPAADRAVAAFAKSAVESDPVAALAWAGRIESADPRRNILLILHDRMNAMAPGRVNEWLAEAPLPAEDREWLKNR
jgi:hypothetical protein